MAEAITLPNNFVTVFHSVTTDLELEMPWPKPKNYVPANAKDAILIWGGSSSVGQFAIQILKYYGYENIITTASRKHHPKLSRFGATHTFDYRSSNVVAEILSVAPKIQFILDCIGSLEGSLQPISKIAKKGSKAAILLPVILRDSSDTVDPEYGFDVSKVVEWEEGVDARGVRTHFYLNVSFGW